MFPCSKESECSESTSVYAPSHIGSRNWDFTREKVMLALKVWFSLGSYVREIVQETERKLGFYMDIYMGKTSS